MKKIIFILLFTGILATSCEKFLAIEPPNDKLSTVAVFTDSTSGDLAIAGLYSELTNGSVGPVAAQTRLSGLSADELKYTGSGDALIQIANNNIQIDNAEISSLWDRTYVHIYQANAIINGVEKASNISLTAKNVLIGEARFLRAFLYFFAINNWGDIPLIIGTNYRENAIKAREDKSLVYDQILEDLAFAYLYLPEDYNTPYRIRPNRLASAAFLARVYLYLEDWAKTDEWSSRVISQTGYYSLTSPDAVFLKESKEIIWQLFPASLIPQTWTLDGYYFVPASLTDNTIPSYILSEPFLHSFENSDIRRANWVGRKEHSSGEYYFPYKYKIRQGPVGVTPTEYTVVFRLAEQYLIRAEARAHQGDIAGTVADLNVIRHRAGLHNLTGLGGLQTALPAIENERRHELFCEWGHRWFDLKRTGRADVILANKEGGDWKSTAQLWPIPLTQIMNNPFLTQNEDY